MCTTNGYIVDIYCLYPASKNDASILEDVLSENPDLIEKSDCNKEAESLIREGDVLILDRGFRDVEILLEEEFKIHPKMPNFLDKNQKQFKTEQANQSRKCTVGCGSHKLLIEAEV